MVEKAKKEEKEETTMSPQLQEVIDREDWGKASKYCSVRKSESGTGGLFELLPLRNV